MALCGNTAYASEPLNYYRFHGSSVWGQSGDAALEIAEVLHVVRSVMEQVPPSEAARERACQRLAVGWVMVLMSLRVPRERKRAILRDVRAIDPHPMRRVAGPALKTVRMKLQRHWHELQSMVSRTRTSP